MYKMRKMFFALGTALILIGCNSSKPTLSSTLAPANTTQAPVSNESQAPAIQETQAPVSTVAPPAASAPIDACSLLTVQEAEAVLGNSVVAPKPEVFPPTFSCDYEASATESLKIIVTDFGTAATAEGAFQMILDNNHYPEVSGIGDRAMRTEIMDLEFIKGQYDVTIGIVRAGSDDETNFQNAKSLAEKILTRLP